MGRTSNLDDVQTLFPSFECDYEERIMMPADYTRLELRDVGDQELYEGRPLMSEVQTFVIDEDGEEVSKHRCKFYLVDDEAMEYLEININLKADGDIQRNIYKGSVLFDFLASLKEAEMPGYMTHFNKINVVNLAEFRNFINNAGSVTIKCLERTGNFNYFSFIVKRVKND